jgi:hypothetical protein
VAKKKNDDLRKELESLRAQVAALSASQAGRGAVSAAAPPPDTQASFSIPDEAPIDFAGLVESLKVELEEIPPMTAIGVFALGLLVGRLLGN